MSLLHPVCFFPDYVAHRDLHSFPTRRSSDLFVAWPELQTFAEQGFPGFEMPVWGGAYLPAGTPKPIVERDRKSTRLNSSHANISYAVFCLKKKTSKNDAQLLVVSMPARDVET